MKNKKVKTIYAFMNAYSWGKSGGDVAFIKLIKKIHHYRISIVTSKGGSQLCWELGLKKPDFVITSHEDDFRRPALTYLLRTINACLRLKEGEADLFYASSDFFPDVIPCFFLKKRGSRWIQVINHLYPYFDKRQGRKIINILAYYLQRFSFFLIKNRADQIIVLNRQVKKELIKLGFKRNKINVCYSGIDDQQLEKVRAAKKNYEAIFLGRINYSKGILDLIDIWKKVYRKLPQARLVIIGTGDRKIQKLINKKINRLRLKNNILYLGYLSDNRVISLMKSARVLVHPSYEEGFSLAIVQALACGLEVIAWDLPVFKELYGDSINLVKTADLKTFADKTIAILKTKKENHLRNPQVKNIISKYSWKNIFPKYLEVINHEL